MLDVPEGLTIKSGPTPEERGSLTAVAGGEPTVVNFEFMLSCDEEGSYDLSVNVDTSDCGSRDTSYQVHVIKGATITKPDMYPEKPTSDKDISLKFHSSYPVGNKEIETASIICWTSGSDLDPRDLTTEGLVLLSEDRAVEVNKQTVIACDPDEIIEGGFHAKIPKVSDPYVYYLIEVVDEDDEVTRSSIYKMEVEDVGSVEKWNMISVIFLVGTMLLLISVLYVGQSILKKRMEGVESDDRFSVLGPVGRKRYLTDEEHDLIKRRPEANWKYYLVIGLVTVLIVVSVIFILTGDAGTLFEHLLEGK
jgi:hypothetical protein